MAKHDNVPAPAVKRLSLYLRQLESFQHKACRTVSSKQLGKALNLSDAQVRKDLAYFGQFGHPGVGYRVSELIVRVRGILGTDKLANVLLVGVGNLGRALLSFRGFAKRGFEIVAAFDKDSTLIGTKVGETHLIRVQAPKQMARTTQAMSIRIGILCVPAQAAPAVAEAMVEAGIEGILNFAPILLSLPEHVAVSSVDLAIHLEQLSFHLSDTSSQ